jgi:hypothetical protein
MKLLTVGNPKIAKGLTEGYLTSILHLAPSTLSGYNTCPMASEGCAAACLNLAGRGGMFAIGADTNVIQQARINKTRWFFEDRANFMIQLAKEIRATIKLAQRYDLTPAFRLNGTSDIRWENIPVPASVGTQGPLSNYFPNIMEMFPTVQFYDYTKLPNRRNIPANYHLTFSRSESNEHYVPIALQNGMNVAVVFRKDGPKVQRIYTLEEQLINKMKREAAIARRDPNRPKKPYVPRKVDLTWVPNTFYERSVFHGDNSDLRFLDPKGVVVALLAKGKAKYDVSGFIVDVYTQRAA